MQSDSEILQSVNTYYTEKITTHGPQHKGVDWNSAESQRLRFDQLLKLCDKKNGFTINDYGCGYGALASYMHGQGTDSVYYGFDISETMIECAQRSFGELKNCTFFSTHNALRVADYTVASGIFNVKLDTDVEEWKAYIQHTINDIAVHSKLGFAFNMLTSYSDADRMRPDLYYGDPVFYFDYCRKTYSRHVALLHDYGLYEFTLIVRLL